MDLKAEDVNQELNVPQSIPAISLWKRRQTLLIVLGLLLIVIALAAGLGGYFGHRARSRNHSR